MTFNCVGLIKSKAARCDVGFYGYTCSLSYNITFWFKSLIRPYTIRSTLVVIAQ